MSAPGEPPRRVPAFARAFPPDAELARLVDAFEAGEFRRVRDEAPALAAKTGDEAVARAARELLARTRPDPLAIFLVALPGALLLFYVAWFFSHARR